MPDSLPSYRTGNPELDAEIQKLALVVDDDDQALVFEMIVTAIRLSHEGADRGDLKLVTNAMKEFRYSFDVFRSYESIRKCTIFGSARIKSGDPAYECARLFAEKIAAKDWMVITGAGPGIMEAGHRGAGAENSFGVNIMLPFEASANPVIAGDPKLINFRYFFTRKVMFMKESQAYVLLPGGFGTMDETFELLTLIQTGKSPLAPVVLLDPPESSYWDRWHRFVSAELLDAGLISPTDMNLVRVCQSVDDAVDEVCRFYSTYHSLRFVRGDLILRLHRQPDDAELAVLSDRYSDIIESGRIERVPTSDAEHRDNDVPDLARIGFRFDRHGWARVRSMIDDLNDGPSA